MDMENVKLVNNVTFNKEKTEELLQSLKREGVVVGVEDLGYYLRKQGLIVKEHIGRKRGYIEVTPKLFGVDVSQKSDDVKEFFKEHVKMGKMSFVPDSYERLLISIENSVRAARRKESLGYEDSFMTIDAYHSFMRFFEEKKKEYFAVRDQIVANWDILIKRFREKLYNSMQELNALDKELIYDSIMERVPSKDEYQNSFYMTITVKAFPVSENLDMFDERIQKQIREGLQQETIATLYEIIGRTLNEAFEYVSKILVSVEQSGTVPRRTIGAVTKAADRIGRNNIFHNNKINEIRLEMLGMVKHKDSLEELTEKAEILLAKIYGYSKELGIESMITSLSMCPLSEKEIIAIYEMIEPVTPSVV